MIKKRKMKVMIINLPNKRTIGIGINKKNKKLFKLRIMSILNNNSQMIIMGLDCRLGTTTKTKPPKSRAKITIKTKLMKKRQKMVMTIIITKSLDFRILLKIKKKKGKMIFKRTLKNRKNLKKKRKRKKNNKIVDSKCQTHSVDQKKIKVRIRASLTINRQVVLYLEISMISKATNRTEKDDSQGCERDCHLGRRMDKT